MGPYCGVPRLPERSNPHACPQEMGLDPKSAPELRLDTYARITGAWATKDPEVSNCTWKRLHSRLGP